MKIRRLRLAGFGPYKDEQVVDFEQFDRDGIFLISGRTGAGKSSILDAICFALYSSIPRYDGRDAQIRSHHCDLDDPSYVELEFSLRGEDYRIWRTPEYQRPAKRGGGMTKAAPEARLEIRDGDGWRGLAAKPKDVGLELAEILPIKEDQFLQVILLAQNRFQKFLLAKTDERRAVLRTLFGTSRFEKLEASLLERRKVLEGEVSDTRQSIAMLASTVAEQAEAEETVAPDLDWFREAAAGLDQRLVVAAATVDVTRAEAVEAERALRAAQDLVAKQTRRRVAAQKLESLGAEEADIQAARQAVADADRAVLVAPQLAARDAAAAALELAVAAEEHAATAWAAYATHHPVERELTELVEALSAQLGGLETALTEENALPGLEQEAHALAVAVGARSTEIEGRERRIVALPLEIEALDENLRAASALADTVTDRRGDLERAGAALAAAGRAEKLDDELARAQEAERTASKRNADAAVHYNRLIERRHADIASELAASLEPGEACMVCGSTEHPSPAPAVSDPITPEAIEVARAAMGERQEELSAAMNRVGDLTVEVTKARAEAGGRSVDETLSNRDACRTRLDAAEAAVREQAAMEEQKTSLRQRLAREEQELQVDRAERDALSTRLTEATVRHREAAERVALQRGDFGSVRARADALDRERTAARALVEARTTLGQRTEALAESAETLARLLIEQGFPDAQAAVAARLSRQEREGKVALVRRHDDELAAARSTLADPELADLPTEPILMSLLQEAVTEADGARDAALAAKAGLQTRARLVQAKVVEAEDLFGRSARLLDEFEQVRNLAAAVHGDEPNTKRMRLETFVLAAQLEQIIAAANLRLRTMTDGRYTLLLDDERQYRNTEAGLGLTVLDEHTGQPRQTASLSGGEMFLASLSLALGLAEVVSQQAGGIRLDTLFVDEGFGSLDSETLEVAMHALDSLPAGARTIGLITHVASRKEQIGANLAITLLSAAERVIASSFSPA